MKNHSIKSIGVIGEGKMGTDIFYYLNDFDFQLVWIYKEKNVKDQLIKKFNKKINRLLKANIIGQKKYNIKLNKTIISDNINELSNCDIIIEAIFEDLDKKKELFNELDKVLKTDCILATNSSSLIPSKLLTNKNRIDKIIGLHFFYPIKYKNIVEFISTKHTHENIIIIINDLLNKINITPLILNEENAFPLNKIFLDFQALAFNIYQEGILSFKEIDELVKENIFPIGVFEFFDSVGNDIMLASIKNYIENYNNKDFYKPLIKRLEILVKQKRLGIKTNQGFYSYENKEESNDKITKSEIKTNQYKTIIINKLKYIFINSSYKYVENKMCSLDEIEYAMKEYLGIENGPVNLSENIGKNLIYSTLLEYYNRTNNDFFYPSFLLK